MRTSLALVTLIGALSTTPAASAQPLGDRDWQLQPYCNRVFLTLVQSGNGITVDGYDDQCGAVARLPLVGQAAANGDGTTSLSLHSVPASGVPLHLRIVIDDDDMDGTWQDSQNAFGTFVLGGAAAGPARPVPAHVAPNGSVGLAQINPAEVQRRVSGSCPAGFAMRAVGVNGGVSCVVVGDITGVVAATGLVGGGLVGNVGLAVAFGGSGAATAVARSDHHHGTATDNTAVGDQALSSVTTGFGNAAFGRRALTTATTGSFNTAVGFDALRFVTTGSDNTAAGEEALSGATTGSSNTAVGMQALHTNTTGSTNTALGRWALRLNLTGASNTAVGASALDLTTGSSNTAVGQGALIANTTGTGNIALGAGSGGVVATGSNNIYVQANAAAANEATTMRLGTSITRTFIDGIRGVATGVADAVAVLVDSNGQLGTISSSRETKENIADLGAVSREILRLRPVEFTYRQPFTDGSKPRQFGLIAEEVAEVMPELVARDADGRVETVKYHVLPTLLLAELQRLERDRDAMARTLAVQALALDELRAAVARLSHPR